MPETERGPRHGGESGLVGSGGPLIHQGPTRSRPSWLRPLMNQGPTTASAAMLRPLPQVPSYVLTRFLPSAFARYSAASARANRSSTDSTRMEGKVATPTLIVRWNDAR